MDSSLHVAVSSDQVDSVSPSDDVLGPQPIRLNNIDWFVVVWLLLVHAGCVAALVWFPTFFSWSGLALALVLHWYTGCIGICLGYHRYLSHKGMKLARPIELLVHLAGALSGQGSPLLWAAVHRVHHARSDAPGDPHSPLDGRWWSHMAWLFVRHDRADLQRVFEKYVPDLLEDRSLRFFDRLYGPCLLAFAALLGWLGGWSWVLWGVCVRMVVVYHSTWFVNSATHLWGYRSYETSDDSRNLWWVALTTYGEGWHNNHHAFPRVARSGHRWWEIDVTWWVIRLLQRIGLAWEVEASVPQEQQRPRRRKQRARLAVSSAR